MIPKNALLMLPPTVPPIPRLLMIRITAAAKKIHRMISVWNPLVTPCFFVVLFLLVFLPEVVLVVPLLLLCFFAAIQAPLLLVSTHSR